MFFSTHEKFLCSRLPHCQVDLLQNRAVTQAAARSGPRDSRARPASSCGVGGGGNGAGGIVAGEEEVVSLRLVGLGVQLHSKTYSARCSFSLQDLELEVTFCTT